VVRDFDPQASASPGFCLRDAPWASLGGATARPREALGILIRIPADVVDKREADRHVLGWAVLSHKRDGSNLIDLQGDHVTLPDLERTVYDAVAHGLRGGEMHDGDAEAQVIESFIATPEKLARWGIPEGVLPLGWWIGQHVGPETFERVRLGDRMWFSIQGEGERDDLPIAKRAGEAEVDKRGPQRLRLRKITRVDLVDRGASYDPETGEGSKVLIYKRADPEALDDIDKRKMRRAEINDLPDRAFAYIEPGGEKDEQGKTTPRSLRHFPIHDSAHIRNALARLARTTPAIRAKARPKIEAAARREGIGKPAEEKRAMKALTVDQLAEVEALFQRWVTTNAAADEEDLDVTDSERPQPPGEPEPEPEPEPAVSKRLADLERSNAVLKRELAEAQAVAKRERDQRAEDQYRRQAGDYAVLGIKPDDWGVLREVDEKLSPEVQKRVREVLGRARAELEHAPHFVPIGKDGGGVADAWGRLEALRDARVAKANVSPDEAMTQILDTPEGKAMYADWDRERRARR
jgi:hypothetical protein